VVWSVEAGSEEAEEDGADAPCFRRWTGQAFRLGDNKEVFDAELYAIYQAPTHFGRHDEWNHHYTVFAAA
jgi:hypothetical protein